MSNFDKCFELVIGHEGGFTDDRHDRGNWTSGKVGVGKLKGTKYGISAMSYPDVNIAGLTLYDAKAIYRRDYWDRTYCDQLPAGLDYLVFDANINHGRLRSGRFLQMAVGSAVDGLIGPNTIKASATVDTVQAINEFCVTRGLFYTEISTFQRYKKGWFRRLMDTHHVALGMASALDNSKVEPDPVVACGGEDAVINESEEEQWALFRRVPST